MVLGQQGVTMFETESMRNHVSLPPRSLVWVMPSAVVATILPHTTFTVIYGLYTLLPIPAAVT